MPEISVWSQNPAQSGLDRFTCYFIATVEAVAYSDESPWKNTLYGLIGGTAWHRLALPGLPSPHAEVALFPGGRALVTIEGTRTPGEFVRQALGSFLVPLVVLPGRVSQYWFLAMSQIVAQLLTFLPDHGITEIAVNGHSQGGAIAQLLPAWLTYRGGATTLNIFTAAATRSADNFFAAAQTLPYTRLSAAGDPVPQLPPSADPILDAETWLLLPYSFSGYRHFGTHFHLFADGSFLMPPDQSTWNQGGADLREYATSNTGWFGAHDISEYARRLRVGIPVPIGAADPNYPGLQTLDNYWIEQNLVAPAISWTGEFLCSEPR
jgi:pimeloyl-ACP methyl ester carboxylesterase